ncbi:efflux RND transporter periplasmic adaptor subunit [soil metagenome]
MKNYLAILLITLLCSCSGENKNEVQSEPLPDNRVKLTDAQFKNAGIATGKLEQRSISELLRVNGVIDVPPQNKVSISVPLGGYLKSTQLLPGMHVTKGQSIAIIEDQQYIQLQQDYLSTQARFTFAEGEYNRQKELNQSKAVSDKIFQQSETEYKTQKIALKSLAEKLRLIGINPDNLNENNLSRSINLYSPINGFVTDVNVNIGKYVSPTDVLFEIVDPTDIHLALSIFEKDINELKIGQKLVAFTNNDPDKKYNCEIILIGKDVSTDKSIEVHCHFEQYESKLIPGMFMNAEINIESDSALTLPNEAIVSYESKQYVFVSKGGNEYEMVQVQTGNSENGITAVILVDSGKYEGMDFVINGAYTLLMKLKNTNDE